jgi:hypothetical protein
LKYYAKTNLAIAEMNKSKKRSLTKTTLIDCLKIFPPFS